MDLKKISQNEQKVAELREAVSDSLPMLKHIVNLNYTYYTELIKAGFSEIQAIELVKAHGVNLKGN